MDLVVPSDQEQALDQNEQFWIIGLAQPAAAQSTVPLFDSGGSLVIGGDKSPYPYPANIAPPTGQQTFYISLGTGNQSGSPWGGGNEVTSLNLSLWAYSATGSAVPVTVGLYSGTDNGPDSAA
ncbi:MAG: hypothetical protein JOZ31_27745 [Verrucomicrobia bacterium]|nr:hypothetical protein [Verrucomicrobiota bacterium]MBV8481863.1 hypothetical protein [Verrucomicrobiota bacterium]